jgi:hypothetical protein
VSIYEDFTESFSAEVEKRAMSFSHLTYARNESLRTQTQHYLMLLKRFRSQRDSLCGKIVTWFHSRRQRRRLQIIVVEDPLAFYATTSEMSSVFKKGVSRLALFRRECASQKREGCVVRTRAPVTSFSASYPHFALPEYKSINLKVKKI